MGRIFFCGDVHGRFQHVIEAVREHKPAAVVFLGDLQAPQALDHVLAEILHLTDIWWIHGNHDTDSDADYDHLFGSTLADRNLHGRVVEIAGVRIAGLGGIFRGQVWTPPGQFAFETPEDFTARCGKGNLWRGGLPRKHRSSIFPCDYFRLAGERADILVTHEAPSCHPHGFAQIDELARSLGVRATFHGHHHDRLDYGSHRERLGFDAVGVGFCGITDEDGRVIYEHTIFSQNP
ncbi:MAG: metallophosphoesterase [Burkholderiaceae bacterium]